MHIWQVVLDIFFPPRPEEIILRRASTWIVLANYQPYELPGGHYSLFHYQNPIVRALIKENKFHHSPLAIKLLGNQLQAWLKNDLGGTETFWLVPIPLSAQREKERGYNQVTEVIKATSYRQCLLPLLHRQRHTRPQTSLKKDEREKNLHGAFAIDYNSLKKLLAVGPGKIILIDDVYTTGTTLNEAYRTLKTNLPKDCPLTAVVFAH